MPQTTYNLDRVASYAGQVVSQDSVLGKYQASESIPFGRLVELHTDGKIRLYRGGKIAGVAMARDTKQPADAGGAQWDIDDFVSVLREGQIWCDFKGTAASVVEISDANAWYPDTTTTDRGKLTEAPPTDAADGEIYPVPGVKFFGPASADSGFVLAEVDCAGIRERLIPSLLSQASNDFAVPAATKHGSVIELNTTAAASTVSLPAAISDGTVVHFIADGTKNGHTLTFRDVATAISAATTASKRVAATAVKASGKWAVTLTVGP